jgi:hypothetical protein
MSANERKLYTLMANSFVLFILAFFIVFIPAQILTHLVASAYNIPAEFHYFKIIFLVPDYSYLWTQSSVVSIYLTTPAFSLLVAFVSFRYYQANILKLGVNSLLLLFWIYAHCINLFFGGLAIGIPLMKGFGYVPHWLYVSNEVQFVLIVLAIIVLFANGLLLKRFVTLMYFNKKFTNSPFYSLVFKVFIVFVPFFLANIFFTVFKIPDPTLFERLVGFIMLVQLLAIVPFNPVYFSDDFIEPVIHLSYKAFISLVIVVAAIFWGTKAYNLLFHQAVNLFNP